MSDPSASNRNSGHLSVAAAAATAALGVFISHSFDVAYLGKTSLLLLRMMYERRCHRQRNNYSNHNILTTTTTLHQQTMARRLLQWFTTPSNVVTTRDVDFNWHLNNGRYARHADFARLKFLLATGLWEAMNDLGCGLVVSAMAQKFRRELKLFQTYDISVRLAGWDDRHWYVECIFSYESDKDMVSSSSEISSSSSEEKRSKHKKDDIQTTVDASEMSIIFDGSVESVQAMVDSTTRQFQKKLRNPNFVVASILTTRLTMVRHSTKDESGVAAMMTTTPAHVLERMGLDTTKVLPRIAPPPQDILDWNNAVQVSSNRWSTKATSLSPQPEGGNSTLLRSKL